MVYFSMDFFAISSSIEYGNISIIRIASESSVTLLLLSQSVSGRYERIYLSRSPRIGKILRYPAKNHESQIPFDAVVVVLLAVTAASFVVDRLHSATGQK